ncbi:MAG: hypothetical protein AMJ81_08475 [Phycisphaerae bacterium SM23_33]|nr:MAG: hypothetical protein AMJ81_08475 [Phycisphaerae bacterium SM23_33]
MTDVKKWTFEELLDDMRTSCGVKAGDILIIHSSQKAIGPVENSVITTVKLIKDAVGPEGTLLLPVFSSPRPDGVFKIKRTPSRVGLLTEAFRRSKDVRRSMHPTHSVAAWGQRRDEFLTGHDKTSGLGVDSPFHKAAKAGAEILMIGCNFTTLSLIHVAEAIVRVPYLGKVSYPGYNRTLTLIDYDDKPHQVPPFDNPGDSAAFTRVQNEAEKRGMISHYKLGSAEVLKFHALDVLNLTVEMLKADPAALLCENPRCAVCPPARKIVQEWKASQSGQA